MKNKNTQKYSMTMEELVEKLKEFQNENGCGSGENKDSKEWKDGFASAINAVLWRIL